MAVKVPKSRLLALALITATAYALVQDLPSDVRPMQQGEFLQNGALGHNLAPQDTSLILEFLESRGRKGLSQNPSKDIFAAPTAEKPVSSPPASASRPAPPAFPYRYAGYVIHGDGKKESYLT